MRLRVNFEWRGGVCLWADDAEARAKWTSAVTAEQAGLNAELSAEATALMARYDACWDADNPGAGPGFLPDEAAQFVADVARWTARVQAALAPAGITVISAYEPTAPEGAAATEPHVEGEVIACFADEEKRAYADARWIADFRWHESATWQAVNLRFRYDGATSPAALLAEVETAPGFVCGWWQEREGGNDAMLAGDPVEHAIACVRTGNATGLANFLLWQRVQRIHLGEPLAGAGWLPTAQHCLTDGRGSVWEWWSFFRNAGSALRGRGASARYRNAERDRLLWRWEHGGSRAGWPANFGEAFERIGLRRTAFGRWAT